MPGRKGEHGAFMIAGPTPAARAAPYIIVIEQTMWSVLASYSRGMATLLTLIMPSLAVMFMAAHAAAA